MCNRIKLCSVVSKGEKNTRAQFKSARAYIQICINTYNTAPWPNTTHMYIHKLILLSLISARWTETIRVPWRLANNRLFILQRATYMLCISLRAFDDAPSRLRICAVSARFLR